MADIVTKEVRSRMMAGIKGRSNLSTEGALVALLHENRITGWRRHHRITGRPDIAFPALRVAVFVDGCFWHACPKHFKAPVNRAEFWAEKIDSNRARDAMVTKLLRAKGWTVIRFWEHALRKRSLRQSLFRLRRTLERAAKT